MKLDEGSIRASFELMTRLTGKDKPEPEESSEIQELRMDYGYRILAEQAKVEALELRLRKANRTLRRAYETATVLRETLYGDGWVDECYAD